MSKHIVLLTSAVYSNYGIYNPKQRIQQTLDTAKSVRKYLKDATIVLVDNSHAGVQFDESDELNELIDLVDYYIDNSEDPDIKYFHANVTNYDIGKNTMEALGIMKALTHVANDKDMMNLFAGASRIFKLSGRYQLTDKFDIKLFDNKNTKDKYVFKKAQPAWIPSADTGVDTLLQTRLWSFTPSLFLDTLEMYRKIINNMVEIVNQGKYIDNEHSMSKFVPKDKLVELEIVGLQGNIAPNGMMIID